MLSLLLAACAGSDAGGDWAGTIETLPNGAVRVTSPAQGIWTDSVGWRLVPELTIGEVEGAEAFVFASASGLAVDDDGRIYVLDRQANELRIFSADGAHVRTVGRSGAGPGEYSAANGLFWIAPDTLLAVDQRGGRYSILTREGDYVRSVQRVLPFFGWAFGGGYDDGFVYESFRVGTNDDATPALLGTRIAGGHVDAPVGLAGGEIEESNLVPVMDTVLLPPPPSEAPVGSFSVRNETGGMVIGIPFAPAPITYLDGAGGIWLAHGREMRITRTSFDGDTLIDIVADVTPAPVSQSEMDDWLGGATVKRFRDRGGEIDEALLPQSKPYMDGLYIDADGYLWVSVPDAPMTVVFALFDPQGRYLGRVRADGVKRDTYVPPVIRNGRLYFIGRDELDVQRVYVYRIEKP